MHLEQADGVFVLLEEVREERSRQPRAVGTVDDRRCPPFDPADPGEAAPAGARPGIVDRDRKIAVQVGNRGWTGSREASRETTDGGPR
jgi:hypothetical protein